MWLSNPHIYYPILLVVWGLAIFLIAGDYKFQKGFRAGTVSATTFYEQYIELLYADETSPKEKKDEPELFDQADHE